MIVWFIWTTLVRALVLVVLQLACFHDWDVTLSLMFLFTFIGGATTFDGLEAERRRRAYVMVDLTRLARRKKE